MPKVPAVTADQKITLISNLCVSVFMPEFIQEEETALPLFSRARRPDGTHGITFAPKPRRTQAGNPQKEHDSSMTHNRKASLQFYSFDMIDDSADRKCGGSAFACNESFMVEICNVCGQVRCRCNRKTTPSDAPARHKAEAVVAGNASIDAVLFSAAWLYSSLSSISSLEHKRADDTWQEQPAISTNTADVAMFYKNMGECSRRVDNHPLYARKNADTTINVDVDEVRTRAAHTPFST